ncbi:MAG: hypothetical protein KDI13_02445 [Alphaproteobacteria bacterium]|nr:hypothetical protein [Alphaproteobacteria bacterium]
MRRSFGAPQALEQQGPGPQARPVFALFESDLDLCSSHTLFIFVLLLYIYANIVFPEQSNFFSSQPSNKTLGKFGVFGLDWPFIKTEKMKIRQ